MEAHVDKHKGRTRIFFLKFATSAGNSIEAGSTTNEKNTITAPEGYQLGGFFGRAGDEVDRLGAVWTSIDVVNATTTTSSDISDEDIQLSKVFGGPHGTAFSYINSIVLGQTISFVSIRAGERIDAVILQVTTPVEKSLTHGGTGGTVQTLTLGADEYITSMEAHWGKKNDHTRLFYLSFTTNAGNTLPAGDKTDKKDTAVAPEGFQLSGFFGRVGDEVDQLGVIWTRIGAKGLSLFDTAGIGVGTYIRNWVGPIIGDTTDKACYRKTHPYNSNEICPVGYSKDDDD